MIILALGLACVAAVLAWYRPVWGAYAILTFLPAYQLRVEVLGLPSTVLEFVLLASVAGALVHWARHPSSQPRLRPAGILASIAWLAIGGLGVAVAGDTYAALGLFRAYIAEPLLTLPLWVAAWQSATGRRGVLAIASAQLVLAACTTVLQYARVIPAPEPWMSELPARAAGFFPYPNALALYVAPLAALLCGVAVATRALNGWERRLWIIGSASGVIACALAVSRGALLALGITALVLGAWSKRKYWWWAVCGSILAALLIVPATREKITDVVHLRDTSADVRSVLWRGTWRLVTDRPLVGAGLGGFPALYPYYKYPQHVELLQYPHNLALNAWVELGFLGLAATVVVIFWLGFALFRRLRARDPWAVGALGAWITLVVHGLVDVPYFKNDLAILTLLLIVIALRAPGEHVPENKIPLA